MGGGRPLPLRSFRPRFLGKQRGRQPSCCSRRHVPDSEALLGFDETLGFDKVLGFDALVMVSTLELRMATLVSRMALRIGFLRRVEVE